jgi:hypothetical protein
MQSREFVDRRRSAVIHPPEEAEELASYRSICVPAIVALLFAFAAPLALISPLLIMLPVLGVIMSLWAIATIHSAEGRYVGRWIALLALVLSVVFLFASQFRRVATSWLLAHQAQPIAQNWVRAVAKGNFDQAFALTRDTPQPPPAPGEVSAEPQKSPLETFMENPLVNRLSTLGADALVRLDRTIAVHRLPHGKYAAVQVFQVRSMGASETPEDLWIRISLERSRGVDGTKGAWQVVSFEDFENPD